LTCFPEIFPLFAFRWNLFQQESRKWRFFGLYRQKTSLPFNFSDKSGSFFEEIDRKF